MRIILTNPRGFCAGVQMAVDVVDRVLDLYSDRRIYVYHEIVHNRHVVERFRQRGAVFVESLDDVPEGSLVVFSAHGVSPQIRAQARARGLIAIDATCPLVTKVHSEAIRYARAGYQILLVGHEDHQEVVGTRGEAPGAIQVVESPEDIANLKISDPSRLVYLTQTTLSTDDAAVIIAALKAAFPLIKEPPSSDICYATTNRQHAVRKLAPECDLVLVVGSQNSSNSVRLTEIARNVGTPAYLIDDAGGLREEWFRKKVAFGIRHSASGEEVAVLLTAGASAPEDLVAEICRRLLEKHGGTIEQREVFEEDIEFALPVTLKRLMREKGIEPDPRGIRVGAPVITRELYGAVPLTVEGGSSRIGQTRRLHSQEPNGGHSEGRGP
ncbi:MAG: 4-hydroxy-3-methylbut-2-enyl diphosphate reductase [Phycisphaerales bacterium]|nr:4-hydroxy-3-methylbut-2-enyl diphosphate reductase [Phycisphaerales bacterium]